MIFVENPSLWTDGHPACGGVHQSPIDINTTTAVIANFYRLAFINYDKIFVETVTNNGYTGDSYENNFKSYKSLIVFLFLKSSRPEVASEW